MTEFYVLNDHENCFRVCGPSDLDKRFRTEDVDVDGFDIIVDTTGSPRAVEQSFRLLRRGGEVHFKK